MARPRCDHDRCLRFARFLLVARNEESRHVCKVHGVQLRRTAHRAEKEATLYEAFDADWQPIIWREIKP